MGAPSEIEVLQTTLVTRRSLSPLNLVRGLPQDLLTGSSNAG